ncbi:MFS transporter [Sorangium sp. So ce1389]|uniref:MFS transporter n=1 Tax=Sorangium sp. So ce1389 TaxID=3133336 RepID=UPI003F5F68AF
MKPEAPAVSVELQPARSPAALRSATALIAVGAFVTVFANHSRLASLPLREIIKEDLGLPMDKLASFLALAGVAWYLKPIAGVFSDHVRIHGTRRRNYILLSAFGGAAVWMATALLPRTYGWLMAAMMAVNAMLVLGNTAIGGLLVETGQAHGVTGRLSALRGTVMNGASLVARPIGGWLSHRAFGWTCATAALLLLGLAACTTRLLREEPAPRAPSSTGLGGGRAVLGQLRSRAFLSVAVVSFVFYAAPGFPSALYYFQKDTLGFSVDDIALLGTINCAGGMAGALCYVRICRHASLRTLLFAGVALSTGCSLLYLLYRTQLAAFALEGIMGFLGMLGFMPLQHLVARACPPRSEAFGYALLLSVGNAAIALSDIAGTQLMTRLQLSLQELIYVNAAAVMLTGLALLLVPRDIQGRERDA